MERISGMDISNALQVEGAMNEPELAWLAEQASKNYRIVEVGCWQGRPTTVLADNTEGKVFAVDHWLGSEEHQEFLRDKPEDYVLKLWEKNLRYHLASHKVYKIQGYSHIIAAHWLKNKQLFDMVFIDASHDYANVKRDIQCWEPLVIKGGTLCGHDYGYPPVTKAVQELVPGVQSHHSIWYTEVYRLR